MHGVRKYVCRMDILKHTLSCDEVTEIFVRANSLGAKLHSSYLALAQITAKWRGALQIFQEFQVSEHSRVETVGQFHRDLMPD